MGDTSQKILAVRGVKLELKQLDRVDLSSHPHGEIWNTFAGLFPDKIEACFLYTKKETPRQFANAATVCVTGVHS
jgi:hypothetical protein